MFLAEISEGVGWGKRDIFISVNQRDRRHLGSHKSVTQLCYLKRTSLRRPAYSVYLAFHPLRVGPGYAV